VLDANYVPAPSDFLSVTLANSAAHGINAMWSAAGFGPDLTAGFVFDTFSGCRQTKNGTPSGYMEGCLVQ
jgi:hypothetical protein